MASLKQQAEDLGIEVDGRWSDETLRQKIEEAKAGKRGGTHAKGTVEPPSGKAGESIPASGGVRVRTSAELEDEQEENIGAAPYPADPKQSHAIAAGRVERESVARPEFDTSDLKSGQQEPEQTVPVRLLYDWWDAQGVRHSRGTTLEVPINEAKRLIGERKAERADPMPGGR